jgi:molybdopterin/thiamine biosynthesis adenylyltransferase
VSDSRLGSERPAPSAAIGALAATFGVLEASKIARGSWDETLASKELYLDAAHHQYYVTKFDRKPDCLFDHERRRVESLGDVTLADALARAPHAGELDPAAALCLCDDVFVGRIRCERCAKERTLFKPLSRLSSTERSCPSCNRRHFFVGSELHDGLDARSTPPELQSRLLSQLGIVAGDVISLRAHGAARHFEIADPNRESSDRASGTRIALLGCGNIGSHAVPLIARIPHLAQVLLVDPDVYERRNLAGQDIRPGDLGRHKVSVQAERLRAIAPAIEVETVAAPLERIPLGRLRGTILLGALDSRRARQSLNTIAFRVGSPWIDMAVGTEGLLCRIAVYRPSPESPCIECRWSDDDYAQIEDAYSCHDTVDSAGDPEASNPGRAALRNEDPAAPIIPSIGPNATR